MDPGLNLAFQEFPVPRHSESTLAAIKQATDIVALVGSYLPLTRAGSKYKALCPFHDDHNPSLEIHPDRQSYKCWSCGAGGDVFDFVQAFERVEFSEALRMLADRAGIALDTPAAGRMGGDGPSKTELLGACAWAEGVFARAFAADAKAQAYVASRGITGESVARFGLGFAPDRRDWLQGEASKAGIPFAHLEAVGLTARSPETNLARDRFRGRLMFPIRDLRGRAIGFGGRILPDAEKRMADADMGVAKYLNSPETLLFQKRRTLYAADLARSAAREAGWVGVVEGYTDVIACVQSGLPNFVGTLGTALGDEHITLLRRIADRVVLVFDGDEAGQKAADRSLELFLGHEVDVRVLTLPDGLDPCDFLDSRGATAFRDMVERAVDPLQFAVDRAAARFDFESVEGARQAAEWVVSILAKVPDRGGAGLDVKTAKALDALARRLRIPVDELRRRLRALRRAERSGAGRAAAAALLSATSPGSSDPGLDDPSETAPSTIPHRTADLDPIDRELVQIALTEPSAVAELITIVPANSLHDAPLRAILQVCYDLFGEGETPTFDRVTLRLDDPQLRSLSAALLDPIHDPQPMSAGTLPAPLEVRLEHLLGRLEERRHEERLRDLKGAMAETDRESDAEGYRALWNEYQRLRTEFLRLRNQRLKARRKPAS